VAENILPHKNHTTGKEQSGIGRGPVLQGIALSDK
jgi:hypothetical protein